MECLHDPCGRKAVSRGHCWSHAQQRDAGKPLTEIRRWRRETDRDEQGRKECRGCSQYLPEADFAESKRSSDGLNYQCKQCQADAHLLRKFGLTPAAYDTLLAAQDGGCAICGEQCTSGRKLAVDHDHDCCPGEKTCGACVRGLLCGNCNLGIGKFKNSPDLLKRAARYLT